MIFPPRCFYSLLIVFICALIAGCDSAQKEDKKKTGVEIFNPIVGIDFYEVRRTFDTGVSYDSLGFVQLPEWHLRFAKQDSVLIYSPFEDRMVGYNVYHDHAMYFHFARDSWRVVELHPDSITIQRLSLNGLKVNKIKSNVYMKFYSERYIREELGNPAESLESKIATLRLPTRLDSAFVRSQVALANRHPGNLDSAFAARDFVKIESRNPAVKVHKRKIEHIELTEKSPAYEYLYPEYVITIDPAYRNFNHDFSVIVDEHGKMRLGKVFVMEDFVESRSRIVQGIIDVYLHNWLDIKPATTLGMPHASTVYLYVKGRPQD